MSSSGLIIRYCFNQRWLIPISIFFLTKKAMNLFRGVVQYYICKCKEAGVSQRFLRVAYSVTVKDSLFNRVTVFFTKNSCSKMVCLYTYCGARPAERVFQKGH